MGVPLVVHGHFYQPPRENPWTGQVDPEPSAAPAHDWNERVHTECYRPNAWARIFDPGGRVAAIVNNYAAMSFDVGPTLLAWLEHHHPDTLRRIVEADGGHPRQVAFEQGMATSELFIERLEGTRNGGLVHLATDGETYGHHTKFADRGLAFALYRLAPERGIDTTSYQRYLADHPPVEEA